MSQQDPSAPRLSWWPEPQHAPGGPQPTQPLPPPGGQPTQPLPPPGGPPPGERPFPSFLPPPGSPPSPQPGGPGTPPPAPDARPRSPRLLTVLVALLLLVLGGYGGYGLARMSDEEDGVPTAGAGTVQLSQSAAQGDPVVAVAEALLPTVVELRTQDGVGSGVIYDTDGYILTAAHVVQGSQDVLVRLADGTPVQGEVLGADPVSDIAVVKIDHEGLKAAPLALGVEVKTGQLAVAIGSPFGLRQTVTAGVVSSPSRTLAISETIVREVIQTDAPINPGNSGGALADRNGRVIGINDAIRTSSGGNEGVGFAVPIDLAAWVAERIVKGEPVAYGFLGVTTSYPVSGRAGALVQDVVEGSPADRAGLQEGDLVVAVDGKSVESPDELAGKIRARRPGEEVTITIVRGGREMELKAVLGDAQG